jgi:homoserine O-acetyltransferase
MQHPFRLSTDPVASPHSTQVREGVLEIPGSVALHHGGELERVRIAWRLCGAPGTPVVVALGGISAHRGVATDAEREGWWSELAGAGRALDITHVRLLAIDWLGGSEDSTGPTGADPFPSLSTFDQADALVRVLNHLGLRSVHAIVGASYGGMVALAFAERFPDRVARLVILSAADRAHPMATAWRSVQRRIVRLARATGQASEGLELARALAMTTYRSPEEFAARFGGAPRLDAEGAVFPVEEYLLARGADYARRHRPEAFLCLSESLDLHAIDATRVFVPTTAVAVREDQLVPLADMRRLVARLPAAQLHEISSVYGHDAFLKEAGQLAPILRSALGSTP